MTIDDPARAERRRRADAERNLAGIVAAGRRCFGRNPAASMTEVAREAGVGRVTLYGYFSSREELLEVVLRQALTELGTALDAAAPEQGDPMAALGRVVEHCWTVLDSWMGIRTAAVAALGEQALRAHHSDALARVHRLLVRGREAGAFRTDVPISWLVATCYALMHAAQEEVDAGRLPRSTAPRALTTTLHAALSP